MNKIERIALMVARLQPLHEGHCRIINKMIRDHETVILCIGSSQKSREKWDPYTFEERKKMVQNVYGDRLKIVQLNDLGTVEGTNDWADYILDKIHKIGLPEPTDYFTGSRADGRWYEGRFIPLEKCDDQFNIKNRSECVTNDGITRVLHVLDRNANPVPSATELRTFLELRSNDWHEWVPGVNWEIVEKNFPEEFRINKPKSFWVKDL